MAYDPFISSIISAAHPAYESMADPYPPGATPNGNQWTWQTWLTQYSKQAVAEMDVTLQEAGTYLDRVIPGELIP